MAFMQSKLLLRSVFFCLSFYVLFSLSANFNIGDRNEPVHRIIKRHAEIINPRARPRITTRKPSTVAPGAPAEVDLADLAGRSQESKEVNPCENEETKKLYDPVNKKCRDPPKGWTLSADKVWGQDKKFVTQRSEYFHLEPPRVLPIWDQRVPKYKVPDFVACDNQSTKDYVDPENPICLDAPYRDFTIQTYINPWAFKRTRKVRFYPTTRFTRKPQELNRETIYDGKCKIPLKYWNIELNEGLYNPT